MSGTTLRNVAERCRMSVATVSHVLGTRANQYSDQTCRRVMRAAAELGYRPNSSARAMRSGTFNSLALLVSGEIYRSYLPDPLLRGVHDALAQRGQALYVGILPDERLTSAEFMPGLLQQWRVDGLLMNYNAFVPAKIASLLRAHRLPSVWINAKREADAVHPDDQGAGRMATEHLLECGHRRIAYVDLVYAAGETPDHYSATDRRAGCAAAMREAGLPLIEIRSEERLKGADRLAFLRAQFQTHRPTAVVAYVVSTAGCVMQAAQMAGLSVPRDLAVVTFAEAPADVAGHVATTVILPWHDVGAQAVEMAMLKIAKPRGLLKPRAIAPRLQHGETTAAVSRKGAQQ